MRFMQSPIELLGALEDSLQRLALLLVAFGVFVPLAHGLQVDDRSCPRWRLSHCCSPVTFGCDTTRAIAIATPRTMFTLAHATGLMWPSNATHAPAAALSTAVTMASCTLVRRQHLRHSGIRFIRQTPWRCTATSCRIRRAPQQQRLAHRRACCPACPPSPLPRPGSLRLR